MCVLSSGALVPLACHQTPEEIRYEAESPDEAALVVGAKVLGFFFYRRTNTSVVVREQLPEGARDVTYEVSLQTREDGSSMCMLVCFCFGGWADTPITPAPSPSHSAGSIVVFSSTGVRSSKSIFY
jgi:hypothetical protein